MKKTYFGIGCVGMKRAENYGTLFRTAQVLGADFIFLIGNRFKRQSSDTMKSWKTMPIFEYDSFEEFNKHRPYNSKLIGVEMVESATALNEFKHPDHACYILGAEDHGLTKEILSHCQEVVYLPGEYSLNVSVAGSIVIYDRIAKQGFNIVK